MRTALPAFAAMSLLAAPPLVRNAHTLGQALPHPEAVPAGAWRDGQAPARALFQLERGALVQVQPLLARDPIGGWILRLHGAVRDRLGLKEDDPLLTWTGDAAFLRRTSPRHEDTAGNPLHFILALWAAAVAVRRRDPALAVLVALGGAAWMALTVPVRFSPWLSRLQLPALVLLAVPIALALGEARRRALAIVALLAVGSLPPLLGNAMKPLVRRGPEPLLLDLSRWENRFRSRPGLRPAVETAIRALPEACLPRATVGLHVRGHFPEYALWAGARHLGRDVRFAHPPLDAPACAVLTDRCPRAALCLEGG